MFRRNLVPVCIGVLLLSSFFLMGQQPGCQPPAPVEKCGQTVSYGPGDAGEWQKGVAWPDPRFTDNQDGTATDNMTGLTWMKDTFCWPAKDTTWYDSLDYCNALADGQCGLSDSSAPGDWRLPNAKQSRCSCE